MQDTLEIQDVSVTPENLINGAATAYRFRFISSSPLQNDDKVFIRFPPTVTPPNIMQCQGTILTSLGLDCFQTGGTDAYVDLNFGALQQINEGEVFEFKIIGVKNPFTTEPTS